MPKNEELLRPTCLSVLSIWDTIQEIDTQIARLNELFSTSADSVDEKVYDATLASFDLAIQKASRVSDALPALLKEDADSEREHQASLLSITEVEMLKKFALVSGTWTPALSFIRNQCKHRANKVPAGEFLAMLGEVSVSFWFWQAKYVALFEKASRKLDTLPNEKKEPGSSVIVH